MSLYLSPEELVELTDAYKEKRMRAMKRKSKKQKPLTSDDYDKLDNLCPQRWCWTPGLYRSAAWTGSGLRHTGQSRRCCLERAYRGCPQPLPKPGDPEPWDLGDTKKRDSA